MKQSILKQLASINGSVTISNGVATLPNGKTIDLASAAFLDRSDRETLANAYAILLSKKLNGKVWGYFDEDEGKIVVRGEALPAHPDYVAKYGISTWSMLDYVSLTECRKALFEAMNDPSFRNEVIQLAA